MSGFEELRKQVKQDETDAMGDRAHQHTLFSRLLVYLGHKNEESDPNGDLAHLMRDFQQVYAAREQERYRVEDYFSGGGPLGRRVREAVRINEVIVGQHAMPQNMRRMFMEAMAGFVIPLFKDPVASHELLHLIQRISYRVFGQGASLVMPTIPLHTGEILPQNRVSDFRQIPASDTVTRQAYSIVLLFVSIGGAEVCLDVRSTGEARLMYYHHKEDVWLFTDGVHVFTRMVEFLTLEWERLETSLAEKLPRQDITLPEALAEVQDKVNRVFDNEHLIPGGASYFYQDPQLPTTRIMARVDDYQFNFINTRGQYADRSFYMTKGIEGVMSTKVELSSLSPLVQKQLLSAMHQACDELIAKYIEPKPKVAVEQPFKFKNPLYDMYHGHRFKGEGK